MESGASSSDREFRLLAEQLPLMCWMAAPDGRLKWFNRRWIDYTGVGVEEFERSGLKPLHDPAYYPEAVERWRRALATGEPQEMVFPLRASDGSFRHFRTRISPVRDEDGAIFAWFGTHEDIDEAAEAVRSAEDSERRFRELAEFCPDAIFVEQGGRMVFVNSAAAMLMGVEPSALLGQSPFEFIDPAHHDLVRARIRTARAGGTNPLVEQCWRRPDGRSIFVEVASAPFRWHEEAALQVMARDVTDRRAAEEALRRSRDQLAAVLDATPAAILIASDPGCVVINGNRHAVALMRMPPDENMSKSAPEAPTDHFQVFDSQGQLLSPDQLPVQRAARGEELWQFEERVEFAGGESISLLGNAVPLREPDGSVTGAVAAFIDITDRKRAEQHQRLLVNELNHRVKNTLAIVQSLAAQSFDGAVAAPALRNFEARLIALAAAHELLTRQNWDATTLHEVIDAAASATAGPARARITIEGPEQALPPQTAVSIAMAVHELCTNAIKYGALSNDTGRIDIGWRRDGDRLAFRWEESGGPPVRTPAKRGFGSRMIERGLAAELRADVRLVFAETGLVCEISAPLPRGG